MSDPAQGRPARTKEEYEREAADCSEAHTANETSRDSFLAVAHTAVFVACVSFASGLGTEQAGWFGLGVVGMLANVVGLLALTFSYPAASRHIRKRIEGLNSSDQPRDPTPEWLNRVALWTFPVSVVLIFLFVVISLGNVMSEEENSPEDKARELLEKGITAAPRMPPYEKPPGGEGRVETGVLPSPRAPAYEPQAPVDSSPQEQPSDDGDASSN